MSEKALRENTHIFGANSTYIAELYERYLTNPAAIDEEWRSYFAQFTDSPEQVAGDFGGAPWGKNKTRIVGYQPETETSEKGKKSAPTHSNTSREDHASALSIHAHMLIRAYRVRGHLLATLDPLGLEGMKSHPELDPARYGFTDADYDTEIYLDGWLGHDKATLRDILSILRQSYCSNFTAEIIHIQSLKKKEWLEQRIESSRGRPSLSADEKIYALQKLVETVGFEEFLHTKYPGTKRFSAEGGENLLNAMEAATQYSAELGVKEVVVGMPHRGRLNVLTAFMEKPYVAMLSEFQGNLATPDYIHSSGDVKYHLGFSKDRDFGGKSVHLSLTPNPSHLEAVNPVVQGKVRAKQDQMGDVERSQAMGLLLHGDAAFCGQGVVTECLMLCDLEGYKTGGTFHIVVNNQVGFTTNPAQGHISPYPTDGAMMIQAPIFHVNGDDPEAVIHASRIAAEYRHTFQKDVVIDMWCYRKHGHNEGDEPRWTQPEMYRAVDKKQTPRDIYAQRLIDEGVLTADAFDQMKTQFWDRLEEAFGQSNDYKPEKADMLEGKWSGIRRVEAGEKEKVKTGVTKEILSDIGMKLSRLPESTPLHRGVERVLKNRRKMMETEQGFDWAMAEALAFGSLLSEGFPIRISGQDVIRGTFSHRHSGVWNQETEEITFLLNELQEGQARYEAHNSNLSEYAVLGYEYGYSQAEPNTLTIWEGQFGDFVNGAQIVIDQFITSAEAKWLRMSGLVMLLPHGYEGQGPEHSSARLERFLQQCAEDNIIVANCTTPANYFHILRRQMQRDYRKPLIMMSPKSLLRHKRAQSTLDEMTEQTAFQRVIPETEPLVDADKIRRVIVCSGKVYYELLEARQAREINDIAIVRLEQFYPFPYSSLTAALQPYANAEVVWCQEEPENMGGWYFVDRRIEKVLREANIGSKRPIYVGRKAAAAPAAGYMRIHKREQDTLIDEALR